MHGGLNMSDVDNVNCMMCLAHIVDGAPHDGPTYIEDRIVHATTVDKIYRNRKEFRGFAIVCTISYSLLFSNWCSGINTRWAQRTIRTFDDPYEEHDE